MSENLEQKKCIDSIPCQTYLNHLQSAISRMATHSMHAKTTCGALITGILVFSSKNVPSFVWIGVLVIVLFCFIDCSYLALEKVYRSKFDSVVSKIKEGQDISDQMFDMVPPEDYINWSSFYKALSSWSVKYYYGGLLIVVAFASYFLR